MRTEHYSLQKKTTFYFKHWLVIIPISNAYMLIACTRKYAYSVADIFTVYLFIAKFVAMVSTNVRGNIKATGVQIDLLGKLSVVQISCPHPVINLATLLY